MTPIPASMAFATNKEMSSFASVMAVSRLPFAMMIQNLLPYSVLFCFCNEVDNELVIFILCNFVCIEVVTPCDPDPCLHGVCHEQEDDFVCECDQGYEGVICDSGKFDTFN